MAKNLDASVLTALSNPTLRFIYLIEFKFDSDDLSLCSHSRDYTAHSKTYYGGMVGSVSGTDESLALDPSSCSIALTGLDATLKAAILAENYVNRHVNVYLAMLDENESMIGSPFLHFAGFMSSMTIVHGKTSELGVVLGDRMELWNRAKVRRYTDADLKTRYSTDLGLQFVEQTATAKVVWPTASFLKKLG